MKISQSKVRVDMPKDKLFTRPEPKDETAPKPAKAKTKPSAALPELDMPSFREKPKKAAPLPMSPIRDDYSSLREAALSVQRIKASALQELEQIRRMRADAVRYQHETATKARSEANQLVLHARIATQREIEELIREASEEIQKMLADIRVIRITAQEELHAQRKFTDAAKINSLSFSMREQFSKPIERPFAKPVVKPVAKPAVKTAAKPAVKTSAKPAAKTKRQLVATR
jgi:hypothetical protein